MQSMYRKAFLCLCPYLISAVRLRYRFRSEFHRIGSWANHKWRFFHSGWTMIAFGK